jgi:hypothetical protein
MWARSLDPDLVDPEHPSQGHRQKPTSGDDAGRYRERRGRDTRVRITPKVMLATKSLALWIAASNPKDEPRRFRWRHRRDRGVLGGLDDADHDSRRLVERPVCVTPSAT